MNARPHDVLLRALDELEHNAYGIGGSGTDRAIVLAVAAFAYEPVDVLTVARLAKVAGVTEETLRAKLRRLDDAGWVTYERLSHTVTPGSRIQRKREAVRR